MENSVEITGKSRSVIEDKSIMLRANADSGEGNRDSGLIVISIPE